MTKNVQKCPRNRTANKKNQSFELKWAKSPTKSVFFFTKYSIFNQSGRAGDEAKKSKSPAKIVQLKERKNNCCTGVSCLSPRLV